jgi:hypothetical protein
MLHATEPEELVTAAVSRRFFTSSRRGQIGKARSRPAETARHSEQLLSEYPNSKSPYTNDLICIIAHLLVVDFFFVRIACVG